MTDFRPYLQISSITIVRNLIAMIKEKPELFEELLEYSFSSDLPWSRRAAWAVNHILSEKIISSEPYLKRIVDTLSTLKDDSQKGNFLHIILLSDSDFRENAGIIDFCFHQLTIPQERSFLKFYSVKILFKLIKLYPELEEEFVYALEAMRPLIKTKGLKYLCDKMLKDQKQKRKNKGIHFE